MNCIIFLLIQTISYRSFVNSGDRCNWLCTYTSDETKAPHRKFINSF